MWSTALRAARISATAGDVPEGKRRYIVRTEGDFATTGRCRASVVLRSNEDSATGRVGRVTVADIGEVRFGYKEAPSYIRMLGERALSGPDHARDRGQCH